MLARHAKHVAIVVGVMLGLAIGWLTDSQRVEAQTGTCRQGWPCYPSSVVVSGSAPEYKCSNATATCEIDSSTNNATASTTVADFTAKSPAGLKLARTLQYKWVGGDGGTILALDQSGSLHQLLNSLYCTDGATCNYGIMNSSATNLCLFAGGAHWLDVNSSAAGNITGTLATTGGFSTPSIAGFESTTTAPTQGAFTAHASSGNWVLQNVAGGVAWGMWQNSSNGIMNFTAGNITQLVLNNNAGQAAFTYHATFPATDSTGTPGNVTIQKPCGQSAIALGASAVTITDSIVASTSIVLITPMDLDATLLQYKVVPAAGSFTVTGNANATAAWRFQWCEFN